MENYWRGFNQVIEKIQFLLMQKSMQLIKQVNLKNYRLKNCDIYVTLEPCHMCAKAIVDARIDSLYFGANEPKTGAIESIDQFLDRDDLNHKVFLVEDICKEQSSELLKKIFSI